GRGTTGKGNSRLYPSRRHLVAHHHREVALHGGEARQRLVADFRARERQERGERELGEEDGRREVEGLAYAERHLAEPAHGPSTHPEGSRAPLLQVARAIAGRIGHGLDLTEARRV